MSLKLNEQGYDILKDELTKYEGSFSKTQNVMLALDLMARGEDISSTQVNKVHLANIIKFLCIKLKWNEEPVDMKSLENKTKNSDDSTQAGEEIEKINTNVSLVMKHSEIICNFYKRGKCKYGKSGRTKDQNGKVCEFSHPPTCKRFELYGFKEGGCKDKKCGKLHLSFCKIFMRYQNCKYGEKCNFFHPKKLKNSSHSNVIIPSATEERKNLTYAQIVKSHSQPQIQKYEQSAFLVQPQYVQQPVQQQHYVQPAQSQQSFLEKNQAQQPFLGSQDNQKKIMDLLLSLNQRMTILETVKTSVQ